MKKSITSQTYINALLYLFGGVMVFLLTFSVNFLNVSAEGSSLPYVSSSGFNSVPDSEVQNVISNLQTAYPSDDFSNILVFKEGMNAWWNWSTNTTVPGYIVFSFPSDSIGSNWFGSSGGSTFDDFVLYDPDYQISLILDQCVQYTYIHREIGDYIDKFNLTSANYKRVFGDSTLTEVNTIFNFSYNANYPVYSSFSLITTDTYSNDGVIISPVSSNNPDLNGHATPPINDTGHYIPNPHPNKPSPSTYTPPSPQFPNIDTSSLEKLVESLIDVVEYGFSYIGSVISGWLNNLISNISDFLDYIGDLIVSGFNNVVGAIQDFATDFYNNMVSLIEPIFDFFSGVSEFFNKLIQLGMVNGSFEFGEFLHNLIVPSSSDVLDLLMDNDTIGSHHLYLAVYHKVSDLIDSFTNLQPVKVFTVPSTTWHGYTIGGFTVDFSWYDDYKSYMDIILSGFLVIGYLYWVYLQLNSLFRGTGSVVYDSLYETSTKGGDS